MKPVGALLFAVFALCLSSTRAFADDTHPEVTQIILDVPRSFMDPKPTVSFRYPWGIDCLETSVSELPYTFDFGIGYDSDEWGKLRGKIFANVSVGWIASSDEKRLHGKLTIKSDRPLEIKVRGDIKGTLKVKGQTFPIPHHFKPGTYDVEMVLER